MSSSRHGKMGLNLSSSAQYSRVSAAVVVDMVIELLVMIASSPWRKGVGGRVLVDGSDDVASSKDRGGGGGRSKLHSFPSYQ